MDGPDPGPPGDPLSLLLQHPEVLLVVLGAIGVLLKQVMAAKGRAQQGPSATRGPASPDEEVLRRVREEVRRKREAAERRLSEPGEPWGGAPPPLIGQTAPQPSPSPAADPEPSRSWAGRSGGQTVGGGAPAEGYEGQAGPDWSWARSGPAGDRERTLEQARGRQRDLTRAREEAAATDERRAGEQAASAPSPVGSPAPSAGPTYAAPAQPQAASGSWASPGPSVPQNCPESLAALLRDPASARRAVVLREILGPPIALR